MEKLMQVLLDDARDKHYAYNPAKSHVIVIDGTASTYARDGNKDRFIIFSSTKWPLGKEVPSCKFLGTVLDRELIWEEHLIHKQPMPYSTYASLHRIAHAASSTSLASGNVQSHSRSFLRG
jgi:hypothetical protein